MNIRQSEWQQTVKVLKSSHELWGAGLSKSHYIDFMNRQLTHPYGKRNLRFMVYEKDGAVLSSCKLYRLDMRTGSSTVPLLGIGAIFTPPSKRGQGYAGQMMEDICQLAEDEGFAGAILYSEIGCDFYLPHGFVDLGETNFVIDFDNANNHVKHFLEETQKRQDRQLNLEILRAGNKTTLEFLECHYRRWLSHHRLRFTRSSDSWSFKIMKESYLSQHSKLAWPQIHLLKTSSNKQTAYALVEWANGKLRVLEAIGQDTALAGLWLDIITLAISKDCYLIHGWVGAAPDFLGQLYTFERGWGRAMLLPLSKSLEELLAQDQFDPSPFLELDHL